MRWKIRLSVHHLHSRGSALAALAGTIAILQVAAGFGMADVAGFRLVQHVCAQVEWYWLAVLIGALCVSFMGYHYACRGVYEVSGGHRLEPVQMRSVSIAGFGGFLAHGGAALDKYALMAAGADEWQADVRVAALAGLEHGVLGLIGTAAGVAVLAAGQDVPPSSFSLPWAVLPVPGFALAFWLAGRYRNRLDPARGGWRRAVALLIECTALVRCLFERAFRHPPAVWGMAVFWAAEMLAVWAGMAAFGYHMSAGQLVLAVGTGMVFTRRTGPLAGAGVIMLTLVASLYYCGAPLPVAVAGAFTYRVLSVWLPMPAALAQLPRLRTIGQSTIGPDPAPVSSRREPALPDSRVS